MSLINVNNVFLQQDGPEGIGMSDDDRRANWATSPVVYSQSSRPFDNDIALFVKNFIKPEWLDVNNTPKPALGIMFALNKRVLAEILSQDGCEGIRIYLSSDNGQKTDILVKPVNGRLEDLDDVLLTGDIKICETLTECPPDTRCPSTVFDRFKNTLDNLLSPDL